MAMVLDSSEDRRQEERAGLSPEKSLCKEELRTKNLSQHHPQKKENESTHMPTT